MDDETKYATESDTTETNPTLDILENPKTGAPLDSYERKQQEKSPKNKLPA